MSLNQFPLRLVAFEEYFLHNHRENRPATFFLRIEFGQQLNRRLAETALEINCHRHPLSRCVVKLSSTRPQWELSDQLPALSWQDNPTCIENVNRDLDITTQPGIKIFAYDGVKQTEQGSVDSFESSIENEPSASLLFVVHHVLFDGLGFLQWVSDWMHCYRALQLEPKHNVANQFAELPLPNRCQPDLGFFEKFRLLPGQWKSVRATFQILRRTVIPLIATKRSQTPKAQDSGFARLHLSADETMRLKTHSAGKDISLNSQLVSDLFVTIAKWQTKAGKLPAGSHFRVMVPINERSRKHRTMASCNHCTIINLDRTRDEVANPAELASGIEQEMSVISRWKLSLNFWRGIELFRMLPGGLEKHLQGDHVTATALFTNLGRVIPKLMTVKSRENQTASEPLRVSDFEAFAPLTHGLVVAFALAYVHQQLRITLQFDRQFVTQEQAEALLVEFRQRILSNL